MKTINNIRKTGNKNIKNFNMKAFAVLTGVAMLSFIVQANASNSRMPGDTNNTYASQTTISAVASASDAANLSVSLMEAAGEENLEVENWMTNENLFTPLSVSEGEEPMAVEEWMTHAENFVQTAFMEENDPALDVEEWMLNESTWGK